MARRGRGWLWLAMVAACVGCIWVLMWREQPSAPTSATTPGAAAGPHTEGARADARRDRGDSDDAERRRGSPRPTPFDLLRRQAHDVPLVDGEGDPARLAADGRIADSPPLRSPSSDERVEPLVDNTCPVPVELHWLDFDGRERSYGTVDAHTERALPTYRGHAWVVRTLDGEELRRFVASASGVVTCDADHRPGAAAFAAGRPPPAWPTDASARSVEPAHVTIDNRCDGDLELFWVDFRGEERSYGLVAGGASTDRSTYRGHLWRLRTLDGRELHTLRADGDTALSACGPQTLERDA